MGLEASQSCGLTVDEDLADPAEEASRRQVEQHCCSPLTQPLCRREMWFLFSRLINCKASLTRLIRWYIAGRGARGSSPQTQACVATWVPALMSSAWPAIMWWSKPQRTSPTKQLSPGLITTSLNLHLQKLSAKLISGLFPWQRAHDTRTSVTISLLFLSFPPLLHQLWQPVPISSLSAEDTGTDFYGFLLTLVLQAELWGRSSPSRLLFKMDREFQPLNVIKRAPVFKKHKRHLSNGKECGNFEILFPWTFESWGQIGPYLKPRKGFICNLHLLYNPTLGKRQWKLV